MKVWVDDIREAPIGYKWIKSVNEFKTIDLKTVTFINLDHDAGDFAVFGGDYIKIISWLEEVAYEKRLLFKLHTMNPVGRANLRHAILSNPNWVLLN